jgi:hypothetical protein
VQVTDKYEFKIRQEGIAWWVVMEPKPDPRKLITFYTPQKSGPFTSRLLADKHRTEIIDRANRKLNA